MSRIEPEKIKHKPEPKPSPKTALGQAQAAQTDAAKALAIADDLFATEQSQSAWARVISCRTDLEYHDRILAFAQNTHDAAVRAEAERIAAEAERIRLEALATNTAAREECFRVARDAGRTLIEQLAASWQLAIEAQGLGGKTQNDLPWELNSVFPQIAAEHGLNLRAVVVS